jgi:hypothetical protein
MVFDLIFQVSKKVIILTCIILFTTCIIVFTTGCGVSKNSSSYTRWDSKDCNMYKSYKVRRTDKPITINADWDKPVWQSVNSINLKCSMGKQPEYSPVTRAKLRWDEQYVYVIFQVQDKYVKATATEYNEQVCKDSCVEFFFTPDQNTKKGYFNIETNCIGTILMRYQKGINTDVHPLESDVLDKIKIATSLPKGEPIEEEIGKPVNWTLEYALPWRILCDYINVAEPAAGVKWRANFYKCADDTSNPHWFTWSKIPLEKPNFHVPEYFGYLEFNE